MIVVDAGIHLWRPESRSRPWPEDRRGLERQRETALEAEEMLDLMDAAGVRRAIVVPPIWIGDTNDDALAWAREHPDRFAVVGRFDLRPDNSPQLKTWLRTPGMLGIRLSYPTGDGPDWLDVDNSGWFWSDAERAGIPVTILCQGRAAAVRPIARRYPDLRIIIDHLGLRNVRKQRERGLPADPFDTFDDLLGLAKCPNVYGKFSSLPYYSATGFPYPDLVPHLRRACEAFGPRRLMWASDISRMSLLRDPPTYQQTLEHVRQLEFLHEDDREWILGRTACEVYNWPVG